MARKTQIRVRLDVLKRTVHGSPLRRRWVARSLLAVITVLAGSAGLKPTYARELSANAATASRAVYLHNLETGDAKAVLVLSSGETLSAGGEGLRSLGTLTRGDLAYRHTASDQALMCLRGVSLRHRAAEGISPSTPDARLGSIAVYFLKELPCRFQVTTAKRDTYELKVLSADADGARLEYWESDQSIPAPTAKDPTPIGAMPTAKEIATSPAASAQAKGRVLHFPANRSLGSLHIQTGTPASPYELDNDGYGDEWEFLAEAQGDVTVPAGKRLQLRISCADRKDLSPLSVLGPDDLYMLMIQSSSDPGRKGDEAILRHLAGLTGLEILHLQQTNATERGLRFLQGMKSLRSLKLMLEGKLDNAALARVGEMPSLQSLYFVNGTFTLRAGEVAGNVTDAGLRHLANLTSLRELYFSARRVRGPGLAHLTKLPALRSLSIGANQFGDDDLVHLRKMTSLRRLNLGDLRISGAALAHLSNLTDLEDLRLHRTPITDEGLKYLAPIKSLKRLQMFSTRVTDKGIVHLAAMHSLEYLDLRGIRLTDESLAFLSEFPNLRRLMISQPYSVNPRPNRKGYTDKGLEHLAKLSSLRALNVGSWRVTDAGVSHIAKLTPLKYLSFSGSPITNEGLASLTPLKSLETLQLSHTKVTIAGLNQLNALSGLRQLYATNFRPDDVTLDISGLTQLETLSLRLTDSRPVRDGDLACLKNLPRLKRLRCWPTAFTDAGMADLGGLTRLESLSIGPHATNDGLKYLGKMKKLRNLTLTGDITDRGLRHLEGLKTLEFLTIWSESHCTNAAVRRLQRSLPNLVSIHVGP